MKARLLNRLAESRRGPVSLRRRRSSCQRQRQQPSQRATHRRPTTQELSRQGRPKSWKGTRPRVATATARCVFAAQFRVLRIVRRSCRPRFVRLIRLHTSMLAPGGPNDACPNAPNVEGHEPRGYTPKPQVHRCSTKAGHNAAEPGKTTARPGQYHASPLNRAHLASTRTVDGERCPGSDLGGRCPLERCRRRQPPLNVSGCRLIGTSAYLSAHVGCSFGHALGRAMVRRQQGWLI